MADFQIGDWVEITPNPDYSWKEWTSRHDDFCGAIGQITEIHNDFSSQFRGNDEIKIVVDFKEDFYNLGHQKYWLWFLKRHVILSSKSAGETRQELRVRGRQLQEWEEIKRRKTDEILHQAFAKPKCVSNKQNSEVKPEEIDWDDEETDPYGIPLPGSLVQELQDIEDEELEKYLDALGGS